MKHPLASTIGLAFLAGVSLVTPVSAVVTIDYVTVGNAGNAADPSDGDHDTPGVQNFGAVAYTYNIGKYEVTNAQYAEFLNAVDSSGANANGIYNSLMGSDARGGISFNAGAASGSKYTIRSNMGDKAVNFVNWYDAARFTNWLQNGQGSGSTETGAYTLSGNTGIIMKNVGATVWLPSENEWYKAAYYDPTPGAGGGDNYWLYGTQSNSAPTVASANATGVITNPGANVANYANGADWNSQNGNVTTVGSALANNYYGTADQAGSMYEWNDGVLVSGTQRGLRGGSWFDDFGATAIQSSLRLSFLPTSENNRVGFRVACVPEPSALVLTILFSAGLVCRRKR